MHLHKDLVIELLILHITFHFIFFVRLQSSISRHNLCKIIVYLLSNLVYIFKDKKKCIKSVDYKPLILYIILLFLSFQFKECHKPFVVGWFAGWIADRKVCGSKPG